MIRSAIALGIALTIACGIAACDSSPTAPSAAPPPTRYSVVVAVTEPVETPVANAMVSVLDGPSGTTEPDGQLVLILTPGNYTVQITKDGYASASRALSVPEIRRLQVEIRPNSTTDVSGTWTLAITPNPSCPDLDIGNGLTYKAAIAQQGAQLLVALTAPGLVTLPQLGGIVHGGVVSISLPDGCGFYGCYYGPPIEPAVRQQVGEDRYLTITGQIVATRTSGSLFSGSLNGQILVTKSEPTAVLVTCSEAEHPVTLSR